MTSVANAGDLGNVETLKYQAIWKKATSGSSAIAPGKVAKLTESTGIGAVAPASANVLGPFGVVPKLYPVNVDADDTFTVITGGGEVYVTADGAIKPNSRVQCSASTAGEVVAFTVAAAGTTPSEAEVELAGETFNKVVGTYVGHVDEGSGFTNEATDAADGDIIRIRLIGGL